MKRIFGFFLLTVPFFLSLALVAGLWSREWLVAAIFVPVLLVVSAWIARTAAQRRISVVLFRGWLVFSVFGWVATFLCLGAYYVYWALNRHVTYGSEYCWTPPDFTVVKSCRGRDHSLLQGRLSYAEALGELNGDVCRALLAGKENVSCHQTNVMFTPMKCPAPYAGGWRCYGCERFSASADWYRVSYFLRADCSEAVAWYSTNVATSVMAKSLDGEAPTP